jgi:hypothetical protein
MDVGLPCGFIVLKIGAAKTAAILLKTLEANEARGRRKFIRVTCPPGTGEFTAPMGDSLLRGNVLDLSTAGMAAWVDSSGSLPVGTRLKDLQLNLRGVRLLMNGIVVGKRDSAGDESVRSSCSSPRPLRMKSGPSSGRIFTGSFRTP